MTALHLFRSLMFYKSYTYFVRFVSNNLSLSAIMNGTVHVISDYSLRVWKNRWFLYVDLSFALSTVLNQLLIGLCLYSVFLRTFSYSPNLSAHGDSFTSSSTIWMPSILSPQCNSEQQCDSEHPGPCLLFWIWGGGPTHNLCVEVYPSDYLPWRVT